MNKKKVGIITYILPETMELFCNVMRSESI